MARVSDLTHQLPELKLDTELRDSRETRVTENGGGRAINEADGEYFHSAQATSYCPSGQAQNAMMVSRNKAASHPIDVPVYGGDIRGGNGGENETNSGQQSQYTHASPLDELIRTRSTSISFNPKMKLDTGGQHTLGEPVKKPERSRTRVRGRSLLQELSDQKLHSPAGRAHSESDRRDYDPVTGELLEVERRQLHKGESRHPLLQATVDALASESEFQRPTSLTSDPTMSPVVEAIRTPQESTREFLFSPLPVQSPMHAKSYDEFTSPWSIPRDENKARSYTFGRNTSVRLAMRQNARRSTSSSYSPASAFLNQWSRDDVGNAEPDDEGQQIGDDYVLGKQIGFGGFSTVKEAYTIENGHRITRAVKIVRRTVSGRNDHENEEVQAEFEHEVSLWRCLHHKHILPLIAVYETEFATFCITRLNTGGTLFDLIRNHRKGLKASLAKRYAYQLASAIRYLHEDVRVVHRDVKLENCLVDMSDPETAYHGGNIVLCDFGMAEFMTTDHRCHSPDPYEDAADRPPSKNIGPAESSTSVAGSLQYASPELINSPAGMLNPVTDIWAFGVVLFALLVGNLPFQHTFQPRVRLMIIGGDYKKESLLHIDASNQADKDDAVEVVQNCLQINVDQRWNIRGVLASRWLKAISDDDVEDDANGMWKF